MVRRSSPGSGSGVGLGAGAGGGGQLSVEAMAGGRLLTSDPSRPPPLTPTAGGRGGGGCDLERTPASTCVSAVVAVILNEKKTEMN